MSRPARKAKKDPLGKFPQEELRAHLRRVRRIAVSIANRLPSLATVGVDELESAGILGLIDAASSFDESRGFAFWTFAYPRVRGAMLDELRGQDLLSRHERDGVKNRAVEISRHILEFVEAPANDNGQRHSYDDEGYNIYLASAQHQVQAYKPLEHEIDRRRVMTILKEEMGKLPQRHQDTLVGYYWRKLRLKDLGVEQGGVSESRMCQVINQAVNMLKERLLFRLTEEQVEQLLGR